MSSRPRTQNSGPFYADQIRSGDPYELSDGHAIYCAPTAGRGGRAQTHGANAIASDPAVESAGIDVGFSPREKMLRAPDISVGNVPDAPGWAKGVPPLAIEYADTGQDEGELADKIEDLIGEGTRFVWVVRLLGPRRVEVFEPGQVMKTVFPGEELVAPGVLRNPVLVEALYDPEASRRAALRNLLQREGYENLEAVRNEGREEGREEGQRRALRKLLSVRGLVLRSADVAAIAQCVSDKAFEQWIERAATAQRIEDVFGE